MNISAGLVTPDDIFLTEWNCSVLGCPGTAFEDHFYTLRVTCGERYPDEPPSVRFESRINLPCVNQVKFSVKPASLTRFWCVCCRNCVATLTDGFFVQSTGAVDVRGMRSGDMRNGWHRDLTIESVLKSIRAEMQSPSNKRLPQPPDGSSF